MSTEIKFDRASMLVSGEWKVEGYWKTANWHKSGNSQFYEKYDSDFQIPTRHDKKWPGQDEFVKKLRLIQDKIRCNCYNGFSHSRFEKDKYLGSTEYWDEKNLVKWPGDYLDHYIVEHNVVPSKEFYEFITNYKL